MKYRLKIICTIGLLILGASSAYCQDGPTFDKLVDFMPPAPNASAIIKYGNASINKNTGAPSVSIPLFTIKGSKLSTSISLGYNSNGIKVDEIASRVGMGWAINAGGVITRTLRGVPDETNARHYPYGPIGLNMQTYNYMKRISESYNTWGNSGGYDAEPDLFNFSFDGYSGSFVFDENMNPIVINKTGVKIEKDFSINAPWNFKITTPDGIVYLFGGASATETTKREQTCGKSFNQFVASAWYLKEIQHLNGEKIIFSYIPLTYQYDNGVTQTMYNPGTGGLGSGCTCTPIQTTTCVNITKTNGVLLNTISIDGKAQITFEYTTREDCDDKLISRILYTDPVNTIGYFDLSYTTVTSSATYNNGYNTGISKTPYLTSLSEASSDGTAHKYHYFSYITPSSRPSRLSFSQDHWGFFNGKVNTSFDPYMGLAYAQGFPEATANREVDFKYAQMGLLQKVVYPTGGINMLFYEPNIADAGAGGSYKTLHKLSCDVTGTGAWGEVIKSKVFHTDINQQVEIQIEVRDNSGNGNWDFHNSGVVEIKTAAGASVFSQTYNPGFTGTVTAYLPNPGDYQFILTARGAVVTTLATIKYYPNYNSSPNGGVIAPGSRVQRLITSNPAETPMVKRYYYGTLDDLNTSSLTRIANPQYVGSMSRTLSCPQGGYVCRYQTLNSSSLFSLGYYNNNLISYNSVVESLGENFEAGGTESKFSVGSDGLGEIMWNYDIINSPLNNFSSLFNAKPYTETAVKKMPNGSFKPVKKTEYSYKEDPAGDKTIYGYTVVQRVVEGPTAFDTLCNYTTDCGNIVSCCSLLTRAMGLYDMVRYTILSSWVYPDKLIQTLYDENGENPVTTTTNSYYDNINNFQLTRSEVTNSKGQLIRSTHKYPHDYIGTAIYDEMRGKNIINTLVNSKSEIVNTSPTLNITLSEQQIDYANTGNYNYSPIAVKKSVKGNALQVEGTIDQYDDKGNILQFTGKTGVITSIIWGYGKLYPVAQIVGATYTNAVAQLTVTVDNLQTMDGTALQTELNHIRTNLTTARVTTYTYKHLTGVTSITDPNNKTNSYQYDAFNQLIVVKDQDGNIVKKNDYVYATPDAAATITVYYNQELSQSLTCNSCQPGFSGSLVSYLIPAGKYYSLISQQDADAKATADMTANGQEYANKNGYCSNSANCTGAGYKFVACACELGTKVCENVILNNNGTYTVTYHYHWSDGSNGSPITETISCTGVDKKIINCTCETGVKVYTNSVLCGGKNPPAGCCPGMWWCTYHYRWSDGSTSTSTYTECSSSDCMNLPGG